MEKKIILDIGLAFDHTKFKELVDCSKYSILYIGQQDNINSLKSFLESSKISYFNYEYIYSYEENKDILTNYDLVDIINSVSHDKNTIDIWDRCHAPIVFNYSIKAENEIVKMIISSLKFLIVEKPEFLLFYECPHSIESWIIAKVAEKISIPVRYCRNSLFHWRNILLEGMHKHPKFFSEPAFNQDPSQDEIEYFLQVEQNYQIGTKAIKPEFLQVLRERKQKKLFSLWTDLKNNWRRPYVSFYKNACYKAYNAVSKKFDPAIGNYVVFFMHLQPERTTLPEGYGFCNHYKTLKILSEALPSDYTIFVKEHPANFYKKCSPCGRWPSFYTKIANIKKVSFVPLETDPYYMIQNCKCVTTITGTIAREALMMGKPVVNFGLNTTYPELPYGLYNFVDFLTLHNFLDKLDDFDSELIKNRFHDLMINNILFHGINGFPDIKSWKNSASCIYPSNQISRFQLFKALLSV